MKDPKKIILQQSTQLDKTSWMRKFDNLQKLITEVNDLADQILEVEAKKIPILDDIAVLRTQMVQECIHPIEFLVEYDEYIECKFCSKKLKVS
jgi:hypothetical protein